MLRLPAFNCVKYTDWPSISGRRCASCHPWGARPSRRRRPGRPTSADDGPGTTSERSSTRMRPAAVARHHRTLIVRLCESWGDSEIRRESVHALCPAFRHRARCRGRQTHAVDATKPLHVLCGKTMLHYVVDSLSECKLERVVVVVGLPRSGRKETARSEFGSLHRIRRANPGVGHRRRGRDALSAFAGDDDLDDPTCWSYRATRRCCRQPRWPRWPKEHDRLGAAVTILTARPAQPDGFARVRRVKDRVAGLVDHEDATDDDRAITEVSTGVYFFRAACSRRRCAESRRDLDRRALPVRCRRSAGRDGHWWRRLRPTTRPRSWASTTAYSSRTPRVSCAGHQPALVTSRRHHDRSRSHLHRHHRPHRGRRHPVPGTLLQGAPSSARAARSAPTHGSSTAWWGTAAASRTASAVSPRSATTLEWARTHRWRRVLT